MSLIRVFEHERLTTAKDIHGQCLTASQFEKLCQFNDNNENKYFTVIRNGIKFGQYVGVIQIGNLTIEILPKADKGTVSEINFTDEGKKWQRVLMEMLAISNEIELETISEASLRKRFTLLDLYFEIYLNEVDALLRKGLTKRYKHNNGNVKALKGRMVFSKNIQHNLVHQERFYTIHQEYNHEHLINQILLKGLKILNTICSDRLLKDKICKLLFYFPEMQEIAINIESFNTIRPARKTKDYTKALSIAKMLILNYSPDISRGDENMLALLFDMNKLWEKYIYKKLKEKEDDKLTVSYHDHDTFWEDKKVYPDIVVRRITFGLDEHGNEQEIIEPFIIDTKWKLVDVDKPSDDDLKQMYVYNMYWESSKSMLLYPMVNEKKDSDFGSFHKGRDIGIENRCRLGFVCVLDENGKLNQNIGYEVLKKLEIKEKMTEEKEIV
jgi:5-methylcytosine-specific restriction enzyme subunit McrC